MEPIGDKVPFISQCLAIGQSAEAQMPGDDWPSKPTLFHWQSMRPHCISSCRLEIGTGGSTDRGADTMQNIYIAWPF